MAPSLKLHDIDQKIKDLQDKKKRLEQKQINDIAKLLKKTEAHLLPPAILLGSILETLEAFQNNDSRIKQWQEKGKEFFEMTKKIKGGGKNTDPSFRKPKKMSGSNF